MSETSVHRAAWAAVVFALAACDKPAPGGAASASAAPRASEPAQVPIPVSSAKKPMPPRPVPIGSSGPIQAGDPPDKQMMAISYTLAMLAPGPTDPLVDKGFIDEIVPKLATAVAAAEKGKTPKNPVAAAKGNRKLEIDMGHGCTDRTPSFLIQRAGSSLKGAFEKGVLVISCDDDQWECHQSTRDETDVLCLASPKGKK